MKKFLAILLALVMVLALVACGEKAEEPKPSASQQPQQSEAPSGGEAEGGDATAATGNGGTVTVDPKSRDKYTIVYMCSTFTTQWCKDIADTIKSFEEEYNFELLAGDSQSQNDLYIQLVETYADQGVDGMILNASEDYCEATCEICRDANIPMLFESTACIDSSGVLMTSGVELNAYDCGAGCAEWLHENYKTYLGDIDLTKLGFIPVTFSSVVSFTNRSDGATETFLELFTPDGFPEANVFVSDLVSQGGGTAEYAYNDVSAIIAAHPEMEHWMCVPVLDTWGQGAVRAIESANKNDVSLVCSVGGEVLITEWRAGYDGCWKACNFFEAYNYSELLVPAIISIIDGTDTIETVWPDWVDPSGQTNYRSFRVSGTPALKDTFESMVKYTTSA